MIKLYLSWLLLLCDIVATAKLIIILYYIPGNKTLERKIEQLENKEIQKKESRIISFLLIILLFLNVLYLSV